MEPIINPLEILLQINERLDRIEDQLVKINDTLINKKLNQVLTTKDACKYLKVSLRSLQIYRDRGKLDFIKIGRKVLYRTEDLDKFLEDFRNKA